MEIESQIAADRQRAATDKQREEECNDPSRRKREVEVGSSVRRPAAGPRKAGGLTASSSGGGSVVKKPQVKRRPGRAF